MDGRKRIWVVIGAIAGMLLFIPGIFVVMKLTIAPRRPEPITEATFGKIRIGMPVGELHRLLGPPEFDLPELGIVKGPELYSGPFDPGTRPGLQKYVRQQWSSPAIVICAILDAHGRVVCRYRRAMGKSPFTK